MKRFSVFVSSTLRDTKEARGAVIGALLTGAYIPVAMEFSPSTIKETKSHIEELIFLSDYVCLIIKGEYGAIPEGMDRSWIELEYEIAKKHGRPIIAFAHTPRKKTGVARDPRTDQFVKRIEDDGTTLRFWQTTKELGGAVLTSLKILTQEGAAPGGWVRRVAFVDEEDSLIEFYRRSSDYDYSDFLASPGDIKVLLNDGYNWRIRHAEAIAHRFRTRKDHWTTIITIDDEGPQFDYIAAKSQKGTAEQRDNVRLFHQAITKQAEECGYGKLRLLKSPYINTHCLFLSKDYAIETPYYTAFHRFFHLPLFRYRAGTGIYDDLQQDFDLIARPLLVGQET